MRMYHLSSGLEHLEICNEKKSRLGVDSGNKENGKLSKPNIIFGFCQTELKNKYLLLLPGSSYVHTNGIIYE